MSFWQTVLRKVVYKSGDETIDLTPSEYRVLEFLAQRRGQVFSQERLIDHLYSLETHVTRNTVEVLVSSLRRKIHLAGEPLIIKTRRGFGYTIERRA